MPEIAYSEAFSFFVRLFWEIGPWLIFAGLAIGGAYVFGWGSGYKTRIKEELEKENREEVVWQKF